MSEEKPAEAAASGPKASKLPMILLLVNFLVIAAALGILVKTRLLYKRPEITEEGERKRLAALAAASPKPALETALVTFDPVTVNIAPTDGKPHFSTIGFALEVRDMTRQGDVEAVRALIMDRFLGLVGRKQAPELNQVQGRFILRTELIDAANKAIFENAGRIKAPPAAQPPPGAGGEHGGGHGEAASGHGAEAPSHEAKPPIKDLVTNVYFNQFIVQ